MKMLLSTTALVAVLALPSMMLADAPRTDATPAAAQQQVQTPGFLTIRGQSDIFVSDLMGHDVHAHSNSGDTARTNRPATGDADAAADDMATTHRDQIDAMDNIGQINEIVLSDDGQIRAIVIGVGGFLGMGQRDVAVTMDQVTFSTDPEDSTQMYVVVAVDAEVLRDSPRYERVALVTDGAVQNDRMAAAEPMTGRGTARPEGRPAAQSADDAADRSTERALFSAPELTRDGYSRVTVTEVTTEMLVGESVYDLDENVVGSVTDMIIDEDGTITDVIINFGGFLGIGTSNVSVGFDELTVLSNATSNAVRVFIDATKEQVQAQPEYRASN
ncbi:MAG: PRC-barrel domain-containing protein [Pararhodobacter sp.]|nr:PRC-barrel domain-containing protein [Pararhodobacter sp.]